MILAPTVETTHRAEQRHGRAVIDGVLRWLSASPMMMADPAQPGGCLRRWWYRYCDTITRPEPTSAGQQFGQEGHDRLARYLSTGEMVLTKTEMAGKHFLPRASWSVGTWVEKSVDDVGLLIAGVPYVGDTDVINTSGRWLDDDGNEHVDPFGTIEVIDWKFTKSIADFAKNASSMANTPQMLAYGKAWLLGFKANHVRLSHGYFQREGRPQARKVSLRLTGDELSQRFVRVENLAVAMQQAARCTSAEQVEGNKGACSAFKGCPRRDVCSVARQSSVDSFFGVTMSHNILSMLQSPAQAAAAAQQATPVQTPALPGLGGQASTTVPMMPGLPAVQVTAAVQPPQPHATLDVAAQVAAQRSQLLAEEQATRQAAVTVAVQAAPVAPPPAFGLRELWGAVQAAGRGTPAIAGELAAQLAQTFGAALPPGGTFPGSGSIAAATISTHAQLQQVAQELGVTMPAPVLSPDAPPSNPAIAAEPVEGISTPAQVAAFEAGIATQVTAKKKAGRKPNAEKAALAAVTGQSPPVPVGAPLVYNPIAAVGPTFKHNTRVPGDAPPIERTEWKAIEIYVDCTPSGPFEMLDGHLRNVCERIAKEFGTPDIRIAPKGSPLEFGGWRGAVSAVLRDAQGRPAPGRYKLRTGTDIASIAVEALSEFVVAWGDK